MINHFKSNPTVKSSMNGWGCNMDCQPKPGQGAFTLNSSRYACMHF